MTELKSNGKCLAIIPAYQESSQIADVVRRTLPFTTEVLVIDDGSQDNTSEQARLAGATIIRHELNLGKGSALSTGLDYATMNGYEIAVTLDGDGQHDPAEIPKLIKALEFGADIVVGCRINNPDGMPPDRLLTNLFMSAVIGMIAKKRIRDSQSGFKALKVGKVGRLRMRSSRFDWESELIIEAARRGLRMCEVDIKSIYQNHHRSKIKVFSDTIRFIKLVLRNIVY
jgi:glycosyltransferase involved in cell wall biosynthesis